MLFLHLKINKHIQKNDNLDCPLNGHFIVVVVGEGGYLDKEGVQRAPPEMYPQGGYRCSGAHQKSSRGRGLLRGLQFE